MSLLTPARRALLMPKPKFNPRRYGTVLAWFAAYRLSVSTDGAAIAVCQDVSGNGRHASQGTGSAQPTLKTGILAGFPVMRFDGGDVLTTAAFPIPQTFVVMSVSRTTGSGVTQGICNADGGTTRIFQHRYEDAAFASEIAFNTAPGAFTDQQAVTPANWNVIEAVHTLTSVQLFVNGVSDGSTAVTGTAASATEVLNIGASFGATADLAGDIAELILWSSLTDGARPYARRALAAQYHLQVV